MRASKLPHRYTLPDSVPPSERCCKSTCTTFSAAYYVYRLFEALVEALGQLSRHLPSLLEVCQLHLQHPRRRVVQELLRHEWYHTYVDCAAASGADASFVGHRSVKLNQRSCIREESRYNLRLRCPISTPIFPLFGSAQVV